MQAVCGVAGAVVALAGKSSGGSAAETISLGRAWAPPIPNASAGRVTRGSALRRPPAPGSQHCATMARYVTVEITVRQAALRSWGDSQHRLTAAIDTDHSDESVASLCRACS